MNDAAKAKTHSDDETTAPVTPDEIFQKLETSLKKYIKNEDRIEIVKKAYEYAAHCHRNQFRRSGEPYITHPLEVALILTSLKLDVASIVAAILHDVVEDTDATLEDIEGRFGKVVSDLVDGLTKIGKIRFRSKQEKLAENFRKMVLAMANDIRVILVKLADRLHNMRTLDNLPLEKRQRIAEETLDIYAPLANRLGIYGIKSELEDLCLRQLKIDIYRQISKKVSVKKTERQAYIAEVRSIIENELKKYGFINLKVYGRPKHFYSIYKKMVDRVLDFEDIHDLFAFRIVVDSVKDCYEALGVLHAMWKPMPGRFKDYIAMPKANMYQSLHTTVIRPNGEPIEIQIRTHEMNKTCEFGVAAHWAYKERSDAKDPSLSKFTWLKQIMEWQSELTDPDEFLEAVKIDLFEEEIFVFTPKGDVIQLPAGATALDFAFAVHTDVGLTTIGAKINGRMTPIKKSLRSGDIIEIMTSQSQKPSKDWLNFVTTSKARNKIRSHLRSEQREKSRELGRQLLQQELQHRGLDLDKLERTGEDELIMKACREKSLDDVFIALGYGRVNPKDLVLKAFPEKEEKSLADEQAILRSSEAEARATTKRRTKDKNGILVSGIEGILVNFGRCCNPLPGEDVVGFITRGRGVTVHRGSCPRALDMDPHRRVEVQWANEPDTDRGGHTAYLRVATHDKPGVLAEVTGAISSCGGNIKKAQIRVNSDMMGVLDFELVLQSLTQLQAIIRKVENIPAVINVERKSARLVKGDTA